MTAKFSLEAQPRATSGKEINKKLRAAGKVPAVIYGAGGDSVSITLETRATEAVLSKVHGEMVLVDLQYGNKTDKVFVREIQRDPVASTLTHVDFYRVDMAKEIITSVPVVSVGLPIGVKNGGMLDHGVREVRIKCLPGNVPPHIEVAVDHLEVGRSIHVSDFTAPAGIKVLSGPETLLFAVHAKQKEEAAPAAAAAAAAPAAAAPATGKGAPSPAAAAKGSAPPAAKPAAKK